MPRLLTTNFKLSPKTVADVYGSRWQVDLFFTWIKQRLKVKAFVGTSRNAVLTQLWVAMCVHLLLSLVKFANRVAWSLHEILPILTTKSSCLIDNMPLINRSSCVYSSKFRGRKFFRPR